VLKVTSVSGNVSSDSALAEAYARLAAMGKVETLLLSRAEAQRSRMRRTSDAGTDIAIVIEDGHHLRHGDVLLVGEDRMIIVQLEPEDVLRFRVKEGIVPAAEEKAVAVELGHFIGNLHRPIRTRDDGSVDMPLQSETEAEAFLGAMGRKRKKMASLVDVQRLRTVFEPEEGKEEGQEGEEVGGRGGEHGDLHAH
jgi:urease accessory protein